MSKDGKWLFPLGTKLLYWNHTELKHRASCARNEPAPGWRSVGGGGVRGRGELTLIYLSQFFFVSFLFGVISIRQKSNEVVIRSVTWSFMNSAAIVVTLTFNTFLLTGRVEGSPASLSSQSCWWKRLRNHFSSRSCFAQGNICLGEAGSVTHWNKKQQGCHLPGLVPEGASGRTVPGPPGNLGCRDQRRMGLIVIVSSLPPWAMSGEVLGE